MLSSSPDEFVALYSRYERKLYRYVASLLSHPGDAEDVLQEAARVLWQKFGEYRREEPFLPWACRVAYYEVLNYCQRERTRHKHFQPAVIEALADTRLQHDDLLEAQSRWLQACVEKLAEIDRRLIQQRYAGEGSPTELAEETGRTPNAVYKSMQRIRRVLLECIDEGLQSEGWG
jgi:RNA polymerase sigma-70 factor, ECF subfamily